MFNCAKMKAIKLNMVVPVTALLLSISVISSVTGQNSSRIYRICIPRKSVEFCEQMRLDRNVNDSKVACVPAHDKIDCIQKVAKDEADFLPLEPEEIYVAHRYQKDAYRIISEIRSGEFQHRDYRYEPVAVIRVSSGINSVSDLKGKKSCHTGYGRNAGWKIPFSHLMDKNELPKLCEGIEAPTPEKDLYAMSNYFESGCAPGIWVPEKFKDRELKEKYPNLCQLCGDPVACDRSDKYVGYDGALKCLTNQNADVAWTKMDAVEKFFNLKESVPLASVSDYAFLCWDGSSVPLTSGEPCSWAKRPWTAIVASKRLSTSEIDELQKEISLLRNIALESANLTQVIPTWLKSVLGFTIDKDTALPDVEFHNPTHIAKLTTPLIYLDHKKNYTVTIEKPSCATKTKIKICVRSEIEKEKCMAMSLASIGRRILPAFQCILGEGTSDCILKVKNGEADVVSLDPKDAHRAKKDHGLETILTELQQTEKGGDSGPFKYAVAVIKAEAVESYKNISDLRGKRSCHGSIKSLAGWNSPLSVLKSAEEITGPICGLTIEIAKYFGNQSCLPGVVEFASTQKMNWLPTKSLCSLCAGDGPGPGKPITPETMCAGSDAERYFGDVGALRCLEDGVADVAFIDHVALQLQFKLPRDPRGSVNLKSEDIRLLCSNGKTMDIAHYQHCNWGKIPSRKIVTRGNSESLVERENARLTLLKVSDTFGPSGKNDVFQLFGTYFSTADLLFEDTSVGLCDEALAKPENDNLISDFEYCTDSSAIKNSLSSGVVPFVSLVVVFVWASFK